MDINKAREILEKIETDRSISQSNRLLTGLGILRKYDPNLEYSDHDAYEVYASDFEKTIIQMTEAEITEMGKNGWFESEQFECWVLLK